LALDTALQGHAREWNTIFDDGWNSYPVQQPPAHSAKSLMESVRRVRTPRCPHG
jgi:hypothetical protein